MAHRNHPHLPALQFLQDKIPDLSLCNKVQHRRHLVRATSKAPETLRLVLDLTVGSHTPVGPLTETAAAAIRAQLQQTMGLEGVAVESHITGITDALPEGKRRVV